VSARELSLLLEGIAPKLLRDAKRRLWELLRKVPPNSKKRTVSLLYDQSWRGNQNHLPVAKGGGDG